AEAAADHLELALGRAVDHVVDRGACIAEIVSEARPLLGQAREDEATIALDARQLHHAVARIGEIDRRALIASLHRNAAQRAVGAVGPAVIAAAEEADIALAIAHHFGAAMAAAIMEHIDLAVAVPAYHHRLSADGCGDIIARVLHLALMPDPYPGAAEDALHLNLEKGGIDIDVAMNAVGLDQRADRRGVIGRHRVPPSLRSCRNASPDFLHGHGPRCAQCAKGIA